MVDSCRFMIHLQVVPMVYKPSYNWSGTISEGFPRSTVMAGGRLWQDDPATCHAGPVDP